MEGSPYRNFSISWKGARFQGPNSGFLLAGTWSVPLSGTRGSGSYLEAGGNDTGAPLRQDPVPLILLSWVPLKTELILNPDERVPIGEDRGFFMRFLELGKQQGDFGPKFWREKWKFLASLSRDLYSRVVFPSTRVTSPSLSLTYRSFLPPVLEMRTESGLSPDSSSIGSRVRSSRLRVAPTESLDSSDSSLDLTVKAKNPKAIVAKRASPAGGSRYPLIGPPSVIGAEEVAIWREKYEFPDDVVIRVPDPEDRVSDFGVDEVLVYEGYFASGFRDQIPSLVSKMSETIGNSPVAEVLHSYSVSPLSGAEWRYHLHPQSKEPPVREILKKDRKRLPAFEGNWTEKFAFMHLPDLPCVDYSSGKDTIEQVLKLPLERRQIPFLSSKAALMRCSEMSGSKGDEALAEYKKALEVMSARKAAPKRVAPSKDDDEVQIIRSSKRQAVAAADPSSSKNKSMASGSSPKVSPSVPYDWATVLTNLNTKVFPSTLVLLALEEDFSMAIPSLQGDLLQVSSQLYNLRERMEGAASTKVEMDTLASQLCEEKDDSLAKDTEIKALRLKVRNQEEAGELAAAKNVSLRSQLKNREEELNDLKDAAETFEAEKAMAVNGAKVVARCELMRECLSGLPAPSFEYVPQVPGDEEVKKTPEPAADDPPAN
ncbi:hypothetical protein HID58_037915 [Brassica napus]|uniref:Uncharacterized protein n=1 Tax=Brassica napus TaxID=3708 RepID=A0ABQ8BMQ7_BRANA|nr:hypothetical protein HID58_037915 [Brassica napus]